MIDVQGPFYRVKNCLHILYLDIMDAFVAGAACDCCGYFSLDVVEWLCSSTVAKPLAAANAHSHMYIYQ